MTKKKAKTGHVALSPETIAKLTARDEAMGKLLDPGHDPVMRIRPWDIIAMERAEHEASLAMSKLNVLEAQQVAIEAAHRAVLLESQAKEKDNRKVLQQARDYAETVSKDHRKLAEEIAARYGFKWSTHSYDSETGEVTET